MKAIYICIILFTYSLLSNGQELPPIQVYTPQNYNGANQNWDISQATDKTIYIANNAGLLESDGEHWRLYPSPNESIMRSVKVVDDYIYSGFYMEFGFWKKNKFGGLDYTSLSKNLRSPLIEDEQFWDIIALDNWILFQSLNRIYIYNLIDKSFKIIESETRITKMYKVESSIYFQRIDNGIFKIENGSDILITNDPLIQTNIIINLYKKDDSLFLETENDGFYTLKNGVLKPWDAPINEELKTLSVYNSIQLSDGRFAIGTISNGLLILSNSGDIEYRINQYNSLSDNTILALFEDLDKNIWLGLDNGINCLNMNSPFKVFNDSKGELGAVYAATIFNELLYLGTNQGLFYKRLNSDDTFSLVKGTRGQVWCLTELDNTLFCGHNSGTFVINDGIAEKISSIQGTWNLRSIDSNSALLLQGNYDGLYVLEKTNGKWVFRNKIEGFNNSSRYFEFLDMQEMFVSHEYKGVFKLKLNSNFTKVINVKKDTTVDKGLNSSLVKYNSDLLYTYKEGVFKYIDSIDGFQFDSTYSNLINSENYTSGKLISDTKTNTLWGFTNKGINFITPGKLSNKPILNKISLPHSLRKGITGYELIMQIEAEIYLFGSSTGYILFDLDKFHTKPIDIKINSIARNSINNKPVYVDKNENFGIFPNKQNNIEFSFSVPEYDKFLNTEYQYQLIGMYDSWSNWSTNSTESFENLPFGEYTFNIRARIGNNQTTNAGTYSFLIEKPWYFTNLMIVFYIIGLIVFSLIMHNVYKAYYKKQREELLRKAEAEIEMKKLENEQQLMSFDNEKLQQNIDSKNRELAISTMSLIKKNEFLNNIKNELKEAKNEDNLKQVIKIIDKNLNNTDDWKFFQEAFNNADKDFLKKIKQKHTSLTPNDLKLCAYLRLNLSSKEIAPLLNISPRSVEVKRYRLRKKISLPHEASLTNYILEI